jgi:Ca2+-binding RTX toxin-like protein
MTQMPPIEGGDGDDTLEGGDGDDDIYGNGGNDTIQGGGGIDYIEGGDDGDHSIIEIDADGDGGGYDDLSITLEGVTGLNDLQKMINDGNLVLA